VQHLVLYSVADGIIRWSHVDILPSYLSSISTSQSPFYRQLNPTLRAKFAQSTQLGSSSDCATIMNLLEDTEGEWGMQVVIVSVTWLELMHWQMRVKHVYVFSRHQSVDSYC
jgi:hypothetical protein